MKYAIAASPMIAGDEVLSLVALTIIVIMGLYDFTKKCMEELDQ